MPTIIYGQVVVGPPGSGKTTYCNGMQQYLRLLGRDAWVINLDPANESIPDGPSPNQQDDAANSTSTTAKNNQLPYETILDICEDVINLSSVMTKLGLGPNGGLLYCMEYLEAHVDDIIHLIQERITTYQQQQHTNNNDKQLYLLLDLPGQVELYTHGTAVSKLLRHLVRVLDWRLCAVQCIDSLFCTDAHKFLAAALLGTTTMLRLELPTVNVLSKTDLLANYGSDLAMDLEYFTNCHDLQRLVPFLDAPKVNDNDDDDYERDNKDVYNEFHYADDPDYQAARQKRRQSPFFKKYHKMSELLAEVVEDFGLLSFVPLDINRAESVGRVLAKIDQANGFVFLGPQRSSASQQQQQQHYDMLQCAIQSDSVYESLSEIRERFTAEDTLPQMENQESLEDASR